MCINLITTLIKCRPLVLVFQHHCIQPNLELISKDPISSNPMELSSVWTVVLRYWAKSTAAYQVEFGFKSRDSKARFRCSSRNFCFIFTSFSFSRWASDWSLSNWVWRARLLAMYGLTLWVSGINRGISSLTSDVVEKESFSTISRLTRKDTPLFVGLSPSRNSRSPSDEPLLKLWFSSSQRLVFSLQMFLSHKQVVSFSTGFEPWCKLSHLLGNYASLGFLISTHSNWFSSSRYTKGWLVRRVAQIPRKEMWAQIPLRIHGLNSCPSILRTDHWSTAWKEKTSWKIFRDEIFKIDWNSWERHISIVHTLDQGTGLALWRCLQTLYSTFAQTSSRNWRNVSNIHEMFFAIISPFFQSIWSFLKVVSIFQFTHLGSSWRHWNFSVEFYFLAPGFQSFAFEGFHTC